MIFDGIALAHGGIDGTAATLTRLEYVSFYERFGDADVKVDG